MTFTLKPNRENRHGIMKRREKIEFKARNTALERWATEGGFVTDETKADTLRRSFVYPTTNS